MAKVYALGGRYVQLAGGTAMALIVGCSTSGAQAQVNTGGYDLKTTLPQLQQVQQAFLPADTTTISFQSAQSPATQDATGGISSTGSSGSSSSSGQLRNGLPPTVMDSFVVEAQEHKEHIYGDEGTNGLPPYLGFSKVHRINTGILDQRDAGLTTGHGSLMPDSWGKDEFLGQEWTQSGFRNRKASDGFVDGQPDILNPIGQQGGAGGGSLPPPPGPGYQPAYTCEGFVGWYSPEEVALAQTDFPAAFRHFVESDRYTGSWENAVYILEDEMGISP